MAILSPENVIFCDMPVNCSRRKAAIKNAVNLMKALVLVGLFKRLVKLLLNSSNDQFFSFQPETYTPVSQTIHKIKQGYIPVYFPK